MSVIQKHKRQWWEQDVDLGAKRTGGWCKPEAWPMCIAHPWVFSPKLIRGKRVAPLPAAALLEALKGACVSRHWFRVVPQIIFAPDTLIMRVRGYLFSPTFVRHTRACLKNQSNCLFRRKWATTSANFFLFHSISAWNIQHFSFLRHALIGILMSFADFNDNMHLKRISIDSCFNL